MIKAICAAEKEAGHARFLAEQISQGAIDEAHRIGKETIASTLARAEAEIAHLKRASDKKATTGAKELASSTANRMAALRARGERRLDMAAQFIVERIVNV